ncbi:glycosyltransferase family 4 protein, partial [bacterium]|nr:glycosyltransferase family 4 protein [bacterium]
LYARADAFVMASRSDGDDVEGFGIVFVEAGAFGVPVVGGRSGGVPEAVRDGESGFLADPLDPADIAGKIARILDDRALARRLGDEGRRLASEVFTFEAMTREIAAALHVAEPM